MLATNTDIRNTREENMQNKPNLQINRHKYLHSKGLRKYLHPALLVSSNNQSSIIDNQWKRPTSPNGSRATGHESRFIQNEPNLQIRNTTYAIRYTRQFMQNEPNLKTRDKIKMQNKPNFTPNFSQKTLIFLHFFTNLPA